MKPYSYAKQFRTVVVIECVFIYLLIFVPYTFWDYICSGLFVDCFQEESSYLNIFLLGLFRPFFLTPLSLFSYVSGGAFGLVWGGLISLCSSILSIPIIYWFGRIIYRMVVKPWLAFNLPSTYHFLEVKNWKIILLFRLIPFFSFDLMTFLFGIFGFRLKNIMFASFIGVLPEIYFFCEIASATHVDYVLLITGYVVFILVILILFFGVEFRDRKKNKSLWLSTKSMLKEIRRELLLEHILVKRKKHDSNKIPVLLLYGFFSSKKSLTILERILTYRGYEVISFNLGGVMGAFFTKGIIESAHLVDLKLKNFFKLNKCDQIQIVAHSKGALVAMWWLLKLKGHIHCKKIITLGAPFSGSFWMWLGIITPLGFFFKDIWQMRPGSNFLKVLNASTIPEGVMVYNFFSYSDRVVKGKKAIFRPDEQIDERVTVEVLNVNHDDFLYRREVSDKISKLLGSIYRKDH